MAQFVDLSDDEAEPPQDFQGGKPVWKADPHTGRPRAASSSSAAVTANAKTPVGESRGEEANEAAQETDVAAGDDPNRNSMTKALGCYPIIKTIASSLDLDSIDSLSRTCRQVRAGLLQYRKILLLSSLRCVNDAAPVDPEETLRYRARAGNWFYMEDTGRGASYNGKSGVCALDRVSECRRCGTVVCRNCAIKPPAPIVLRDRLRRLCKACTKAPITELVKPNLAPETLLSSDAMQRKVCQCVSNGVWLCQPCGRSIRGADHDYQAIWRWRSQYGEVLGGIGTGIGECDRGVPCGREEDCHGAKDCEHETDCDAADAAADDYFFSQQQRQQLQQDAQPSSPAHHNNFHTNHQIHQNLQNLAGPANDTTTQSSSSPSPPTTPNSAHGSSSSFTSSGNNTNPNPNRRLTPSPGYARHEIEGIGGVVKTKLVRMVKVGAGVPEWEDERARGQILGREMSGRVRSWCGWCWRVVPGQKDVERDGQQPPEKEKKRHHHHTSSSHLSSSSSSSASSSSSSLLSMSMSMASSAVAIRGYQR